MDYYEKKSINIRISKIKSDIEKYHSEASNLFTSVCGHHAFGNWSEAAKTAEKYMQAVHYLNYLNGTYDNYKKALISPADGSTDPNIEMDKIGADSNSLETT